MSDNDDYYPNLFRAVEDACSAGWLSATQRDTVFLAVKAYRPSTPRPDLEPVHSNTDDSDGALPGVGSGEGTPHVHVFAGHGTEAVSPGS